MFSRFAAALIVALALALPATAADYTIHMVNKDTSGRAMQFDAAFLKIDVGDTVHFVGVDKGHNSESLMGGIPEGAEPWKGGLSQDITVTFTVEGLYAFKCMPHVAMGMVGLIQVGSAPANLDAIRALKIPGKGGARLGELLTEAGF